MAVGALGAVVLDDPLLQAVAMKYVFHVARQLHDAILVLEPFHADAAVEALLKDDVTECYSAKLFVRVRTPNATSIETADAAKGQQRT